MVEKVDEFTELKWRTRRLWTTNSGIWWKRTYQKYWGEDYGRRKVAISELYTEDCMFFEVEEQFVDLEALNARAERILQDNPGFVLHAVACTATALVIGLDC